MVILSLILGKVIYMPNEARAILDLPSEDGGDQLMTNGNYIPLTMVGQQYSK